jgi:large subunit ribosomal protein L15
MQIHELKNPFKKDKKRVGRGGKRGTYSGKGQKGQRARAGHRIRPASRDIIQRLPKLRGVKNKLLSQKPNIVNVGDLNRLFKDGSEVNPKTLRDLNFVKRPGPVKILSDGELSKKLKIKGLEVSRKAKEKILKAGGRIE